MDAYIEVSPDLGKRRLTIVWHVLPCRAMQTTDPVAADQRPDHAAAADQADALATAAGRTSGWLSLTRVVVFAGLVVVAAGAVAAPGAWSVVLASALLAGFLVLALVHAGVDQRRDRARALAAWHRRGVARMAGEPDPAAPAGYPEPDQRHAFAGDLDCFGPGGVLARLDTGGSDLGRRQIARWLLGEAPCDAREQQRLVRALVPAHAWRAALAVDADAGQHRAASASAQQVTEWLTQTDPGPNTGLVMGTWVLRLAGMAAIAALAWQAGGGGLILGVLAVAMVFTPIDTYAVARLGLGDDAIAAAREIRAQAAALGQIAQLPAAEDDPELTALVTTAKAGAAAFADAAGLVGRTAARANPMRSLIGAVVLAEWWTWAGLAKWRQQHADQVTAWQDAIARAEALASLATWAAEQGGCWPVFTDDGVFEAAELAHPLLPSDRRVANDIDLRTGQVLLLTGANASGKSTFLRSIGLAAVMASIGLPVCAQRCRLSVPRLATVMRVGDDLLGGRSRFQAEVAALRQVLDLVEADDPRPVLLALDEILAGTNSRERHIGTRAILEHLDGRPAIVLVTSHDLELVAVAEERPQQVVLAHFADRAVLHETDGDAPGDVVFDYRLRPGRLTSTNAVRVMRAAGLPVPASD